MKGSKKQKKLKIEGKTTDDIHSCINIHESRVGSDIIGIRIVADPSEADEKLMQVWGKIYKAHKKKKI